VSIGGFGKLHPAALVPSIDQHHSAPTKTHPATFFSISKTHDAVKKCHFCSGDDFEEMFNPEHHAAPDPSSQR
jgi:hypothetical protein